ncbi:MAG TPA: hypothetical protein ENH75_05875 [archaeon]|nr:hypothetical protein [archaeon]
MTIKKDITFNTEMFPLTKAIVLESFDAWTYTKGEGYFRSNAVKSWEAKKNGITGKVEGNWAPYYSIELQIKNDRLNGSCSCPVAFNCKHCVALALQWLKDNNNSQKKKIKNESEDNYLLRNDDSEEESEYEDIYKKESRLRKNKAKILNIPMKLKTVPIQDINAYLQSLSRPDLENLVGYFMRVLTKNQKITVFSPGFIMMTWKSRFAQLDDNFKSSVKNNDLQSPLKIIEQINDDGAKQQCVQTWFKGYVDLITQIKIECQLRGLLELNGEELYEYYKNEEYSRVEAEHEEESNERLSSNYKSWDYDDYDELEPYEDFDLDTSTLKSYLEDFFNWIFAPVQELCEFIFRLNQCCLESHVNYLITEGIQWLIDLDLPTKDFGIDPKNISALQDLKSLIISKLSVLTTTFSNHTEELDFLFQLFTQNPSQRSADLISTQLQQMSINKENFQYFIQKLLEDYTHSPKWEKFDLLKRLINIYAPLSLSSFLYISINTLPKCPDAELIIKEIFGIIEGQPIETTLTLEPTLLKSTQMIPKKFCKVGVSIYQKTVDWLVKYFHQRHMIDHAFTLLVDFAKKRPKSFEFSHYQTIKKFIPLLANQFEPEFENLISLIIQKGDKDVKFRLLLDLGQFDKACELLKDFKTFSYSYLDHHNPQWRVIIRLIPHVSSITDKNKELMVSVLKSQITQWLSHTSRNRPDASIAETIAQIQTLYLAFKTRDGIALWQKWFKKFSNNHWRLRNLRGALSNKGIEMKKS